MFENLTGSLSVLFLKKSLTTHLPVSFYPLCFFQRTDLFAHLCVSSRLLEPSTSASVGSSEKEPQFLHLLKPSLSLSLCCGLPRQCNFFSKPRGFTADSEVLTNNFVPSGELVYIILLLNFKLLCEDLGSHCLSCP